MRSMLWDLRLSNDSTLTAADAAAQFSLDPEQKQLLVFTFATDEIAAPPLLFELESCVVSTIWKNSTTTAR